MIINRTEFNVDLETILIELRDQLRANNIQYIEKIKPSGQDIMVSCPYHADGQERRPSAGIRTKDGLFHCFACGEVHSLPEVISHCFGYVDDVIGKFGWQWLLKNFATVQAEERKDVELDCSRGSNNNFAKYGNITYVTEEELDKYRYTHPYMYKRGLTDDIINLFDIGYDRHAKTITFPVRDIEGNCLFVARRSISVKWYNYPHGVQKPLYGLYELYLTCRQEEPVIVCEGMFDALTCWVYDKPAVALNGLGNELQFEQLRDLPCRKLILATDNDESGIKARERIRMNIRNRKLISEYILPKGKKDINELSKEEFENLLEIF